MLWSACTHLAAFTVCSTGWRSPGTAGLDLCQERTYYPFLHKYQMPGFMTEFGAVGGNKNEMKHITSGSEAVVSSHCLNGKSKSYGNPGNPG